MVSILALTYFIWVLQALRQMLAWAYWLQEKEYRFDRFLVFLKTIDGRKKISLFWICIKLLLLSFSLFIPEFRPLLLILLFFLSLLSIKEALTHTLRRPVPTSRMQKMLGLASLIFLIPVFRLFNVSLNFYSLIFVSEVLFFPLLSIGIYWTSLISSKVKAKEIKEAKQILKEVKPIVIGITGSYGKSSTKEFVFQMLSSKFKVVKSIASQNTVFGIIRAVKENIKKDTQIFVCEMGAYKIGEIKEICEITHPTFGVLTGIEPQHLSLFGSLEAIKKAKFELIESLPKESNAFFNYSNKDVKNLSLKAQNLQTNLNIFGYGVGLQEKQKNIYSSKIVSEDINGVYFNISEKGKEINLYAPLKGSHLLENLTAAISVARVLGVSWQDIKNSCKNLSVSNHTMSLLKLSNDVYIVDDSYNATPKSFDAAINYLKKFENYRKVIITTGIIELGDRSEEIHTELAKKLSDFIDLIILTNKEYYPAFKNGLNNMVYKLKYISDSKALVRDFVDVVNSEKTVILLEGRMPHIFMERLKQYESK